MSKTKKHIEHYPNGEIKEEGYYLDGKKDGKWTHWLSDGSLVCIERFKNGVKKSEDIFKKIEKDLIWLNVKYGQVVIFDQSFPHGNIVNRENESRWSMNCRFKSIFTPYADKKIGEYYEPITLKAASKRGISYKFPK